LQYYNITIIDENIITGRDSSFIKPT
jgi:hypothetical protein